MSFRPHRSAGTSRDANMCLLPAPTTTQTHTSSRHTPVVLYQHTHTQKWTYLRSTCFHRLTTCEQIFTPPLGLKEEKTNNTKRFLLVVLLTLPIETSSLSKDYNQCFCTFLSLKMQLKSRDWQLLSFSVTKNNRKKKCGKCPVLCNQPDKNV